jgi:hypothetical protein
MSAIDHLKAAIERFKAEGTPRDRIEGDYDLNGPESDREGHHPEYPSGSTESTSLRPAD